MRATPAAGDAIHAGISAKDAIVTTLTGATSTAKGHAKAARELLRLLVPTATLRQRRSRSAT